MKRVLITGASGLLGETLVSAALARGLTVTGQYRHHQPPPRKNCHWLTADFSDRQGMTSFLEDNGPELSECRYLIHGYGPITHKDLSELTATDFCRDFCQNLVSAVTLSQFLISRASLESAIYIGFEFCGQDRAYRNILSYAIAKNGLLSLTRSYAKRFPAIHFNMVSPVTLAGARIKRKGGDAAVAPDIVAATVLEVLLGRGSGQHHIDRKGRQETADGL